MGHFSKSTWVIILAVTAALWLQFMKRKNQCNSKTDLTGKTVVITGGNTGIGYETALGIARRNAKVIIACRNEQRAKQAVEDIKKSTGSMSVEYIIVDFAELADIRRAAEEFTQKEDRLDILINNAGLSTWGKTKDGFDMMFGVNHLGYFLFTSLLMPIIWKTAKNAPVRIVNVSSGMYKMGTIDLDNLNPDITNHSGIADIVLQYSNTKLMNVYFTSELDARLKEDFNGQQQAITTYSLHPGTINTDLISNWIFKQNIMIRSVKEIYFVFFGQTAADGAQTSLCCAVEEGIEKYSGGYFASVQPVELRAHARDPEIGRKLWTISEQLTGVKWGS